MDKNSYYSVFESHPKANTIWVVKGQPFLEQSDADNYAKGFDGEVPVKINRNEVQKPKPAKVEAPKEPAKGAAKEPAKVVEPTPDPVTGQP
jgi:hypothetical protein